MQGLLPPLVVRPTFTIHKPASEIFSLQDYVDKQVITAAERDVLVQAVIDRQNILVGGGTFTGKTTFANALLAVVAEQTPHRVYIAEDTRELQFAGEDAVFVLTDPDLNYDMQRAVPRRSSKQPRPYHHRRAARRHRTRRPVTPAIKVASPRCTPTAQAGC